MKKVILAVFAFLFLFAGVVQADYTFTEISISGTVDGSILNRTTGVTSPSYSDTATVPTSDSVSNMYASASSSFNANRVYTEVSITNPGGPDWRGTAQSDASVSVLFRPNFTGLGPTISMGSLSYGTTTWSIEDTTDGSLVAEYKGPYQWFTYDTWDPTHVYRFDAYAFSIGGSVPGDRDIMSGAFVQTDILFTTASVPEPATMLLLGLGLMGVLGIRRKIQK